MAKAAAGSGRISAADVARLQAHLRRTLGSAAISLDAQAHRGASVQVLVGREVVGTVDQVDEEGERSWAVTLVVLEDDLAG